MVHTPACPGDPPNVDRNVTLAWDENPEQDIAGYILRWGFTSGEYTSSTDVGNHTRLTVPNLVTGATYYFVVSAYNESGLEGDPSTELAYMVP